MGKPSLKKKRGSSGASKGGVGDHHGGGKPGALERSSSKVLNDDNTIFAEMAQELREEGNKLFQRRDYERTLLNYEKAVRLLLASATLDAAPKYCKTLLKQACCFEALGRLDLAASEVNKVLAAEPRNLTALEVADRVRRTMEEKGFVVAGEARVNVQRRERGEMSR